jgi:hypothetical protein
VPKHTLGIFRVCRARLVGAYGQQELAWTVNHMPIRIANFPHLNGEVTMKLRSTDRLAAPRGDPLLATRPVSGAAAECARQRAQDAPAMDDG